ncbi:MAG: hypothetical protein JO040_01155 [Gemmatimonadetes bacterium]|nr:hypothetical protein [Gemmatimonadota bacterium]
MTTDTHGTAERGRQLVADAIRSRGAQVSEIRRGNLVLLECRTGAQRIHLRVKTRTSGTWQGSTQDGHPDPVPSRPEVFWVFVDLERPSSPKYFIAPDEWMRRDIHRAHQSYLARHGGERAISKDSTHHAIEPRRVLQWKDRWDLFGL